MSKITKSRLFELLSARHLNNPYSRLADLPSPEKFKDIDIACKRIKKAILEKETITIVGDYDVDGVISTTIMLDFFNTIGVKVNHIIPNRFEHGYGLSTKIVDLINEGLVITVDNGISAYEASVKLKEKNIDLIITDHHTVGTKIPIALAIINPKQQDCNFEFKDICGAQVAWYLCAAIKKEMNLDVNMGDYLDLLCVAIIADIMPMTTLNYTIVKQGLKKIKSSSREAFKILNEIMAKKSLVSDDIGFFIAPKLNSAGRMDDASIALEFLLSENSQNANETLSLLEELNNYRKTLQEEISKKADSKTNKGDNADTAKLLNHVTHFIDWVLSTHLSQKDDNDKTTRLYANPFEKVKRKISNTETIYNPLPYRYICDLRHILCPKPRGHFVDWLWAQQQTGQGATQGGDWFEVDENLIDKKDQDCVWRSKKITRNNKRITIYQI